MGLGFVHQVGSQHSLCNSQDPGCPQLLHLGVLEESGEGILGVPCVEEAGVGGRSSERAGLDSEFRSFTHTVKAVGEKEGFTLRGVQLGNVSRRRRLAETPQ